MTQSPAQHYFYCPVHQIRILRNGAQSIVCEQGSHALGEGFPLQSWWKYCCDCSTFWPAELLNGVSSNRCTVCERETAKRFVCAACQVISIESAAVVRRKFFSIDSDTGVKPRCPGCQATATGPLKEHDCSEIGFAYLTSRPICLFCEGETGASTPKQEAKAYCWSCTLELSAPFRFCKRCGSKQREIAEQSEQPLVIPHQPQSQTTRPSDRNTPELDLLDLPDTSISFPDLQTDPDWPTEDECEEDIPGADHVSAHESDVETSTVAIPDYSTPSSAPLSPPKRRTSWAAAIVALVVVSGILGTVVLFYKSSSPRRVVTPTPVPITPPAGMVYLAGGEFLMGTDEGDEFERPAHKVTVGPFFIDTTEVTCAMYQQFIKESGHRAPPRWSNGLYPTGTADLPVTGVDWYDANVYAQWANKRLPTEEEWEFAAQSGKKTKYAWGDQWISGAANAGDSSAQHLVSVGTHDSGKTPSGGLKDMIGNAWEWTSSDVLAYPNGHLTQKPPDDAKIIRGGSWQESKDQATTTYRGYLPKSGAADYGATGFRCVKNVETSNQVPAHK